VRHALSLLLSATLNPHLSAISKRLACQTWVSSHWCFLYLRSYWFSKNLSFLRCLRHLLLDRFSGSDGWSSISDLNLMRRGIL